MKIFKGFLSFILGILIFVLLFAVSLSLAVKNTLQREVLTAAVETKGYEIMEDLLDEIEIDEVQKTQIMDTLRKDDTYVKYMKIYVDNYIKYVGDENYKVSKSDANKISVFVNTTLKDITDTLNISYEITEDDYELVDTIFKSTFKFIDESTGEDFVKVMRVYSFVTSNTIILLAVASILVFVILTSLLVGLRKGLRNLGINSLITGIILGIGYGLFLLFKKDILASIPFDISLINLIVTACITFILGLVLIIVSKKIKKSQENE